MLNITDLKQVFFEEEQQTNTSKAELGKLKQETARVKAELDKAKFELAKAREERQQQQAKATTNNELLNALCKVYNS